MPPSPPSSDPRNEAGISGYVTDGFFDEMFDAAGALRPHYRRFAASFNTVARDEWEGRRHAVDALFLRPGQQHGPFRLPNRDRSVIVISGKGELVIHADPVDQRIDLAPGLIALAPRDTWHAILNTGHGDLVVALASQFPAQVEERG